MKYKKQIATSALAISLLVGGSPVFATTPEDLGIKNIQSIYQKQNRNSNNVKVRNKKRNNNSVVGTIGAINGTGFTVNIKNLKTKTAYSADVITGASTLYKKDGTSATARELSVGQKVMVAGIVAGISDKATNILTAKIVKISTNGAAAIRKSKVG